MPVLARISYTSIANGYPGLVWVSFSNAPLEIDKLQLLAAVGNGHTTIEELDEELENVTNSPWDKIGYGNVHTKSDRSGTTYVTMVACPDWDEAGGKVIVYDFEIKPNLSLIVTKDCDIQQQMPGNENKFVDCEGVNHKPSPGTMVWL